ncbi:MAG TPA: hypothetical protein VN821_13805 [Candidatus Udaeobacter sp.]|nr:hypothetical protein [Candidatus Udaeobacter sp.]
MSGSNQQNSALGPADAVASGSPGEKPWLKRKDWAAGIMRDSVGLHLDVFVIAFMGLVFLAVAFGFYHERLHLAPDGGFGPFIPMAIFGLVGAGMTLKAVHLVMSWARYGRSRLKLETVPIPLGGAMKAELIMTRQFRAGRQLRVTLKCVNSVVHDYQSINKPFPTAEERSVDSHAVWQDEDTLVSDGSGLFKIAFAVPADQPATTFPNGRDWRTWVLDVQDASGRTQAYHAEFELPVFAASLGAGEAAAVAAIAADRERRLEDYKPGPGFRVKIRPAAEGGTEFLIPPIGRAGGAVAQSIVFAVSFVLMLFAYGQIPLVVIVPWGVLNLLLYLWLARLWFAAERIVIGNGVIRVTNGLFRITQSMAIDQVASIHAVPIETPWVVTVRIRGQGWRQIGTGQGIRELAEAQWLALQMSHAAGIKAASPIPGNETAEMMEMVLGFAKEKGVPGAAEALQSKAAVDRLKQHLDPKYQTGEAPAGNLAGTLPLSARAFRSKPTSPVTKIIVAAIGLVGLLWLLSSVLHPIFAVLMSRLRH